MSYFDNGEGDAPSGGDAEGSEPSKEGKETGGENSSNGDSA